MGRWRGDIESGFVGVCWSHGQVRSECVDTIDCSMGNEIQVLLDNRSLCGYGL
jgi:hypothetical protein